MRKAFTVLGLAVLFCLPAFGQTTAPTTSDLGFSNFSMTFSALGIHGNGGTVPVADMGQSIAVVPGKLSARLDEFLSSSNSNFTGYFAGPTYFFGPFKSLQKTTLAPLQLSIAGEGGITRTTPAVAGANPVNKPAARVLLTANWNPQATGAVSFKLFDVGYAYLPNLVPGHNNYLTFSAGVKISLP